RRLPRRDHPDARRRRAGRRAQPGAAVTSTGLLPPRVTAPTAAVTPAISARGSALTMVTVYVVLLLAWPSYVTVSALGSLGRPSLLWGLGMLLWWVLSRLQDGDHRRWARLRQPVRWTYGALLVVVLVSFAAAMLRGQPGDQVTVAITSVIRMLSWGGVFLVLADGITTQRDLERLLARLTLAGTLLAILGLMQFVLEQSLLDWVAGLPGVTADTDRIIVRGDFARAAGTATHPLEYTAAICAILPLAVTVGLAPAPR